MSTNELHTLAISLDLSPDETINPHHYTFQLSDSCSDTLPTEHSPKQVSTSTETEQTDTLLGKGGMGLVMLGRQNIPVRDVAIKKLINITPVNQRALLQEAHIMGALEHPNIVPVHEVQIDADGSSEVIMKRIDGNTLSEIVNKKPQRGEHLQKTLQILISVCHALEFAHSHSIVHRDIKTDNIMVGAFNEVYLMDWGLAFNLMTPDDGGYGVVGTPHYIAPEMLLGKPDVIDVRTDIYLLGATLHHILTGENRHQAATIAEALLLSSESKTFEYDDDVPHHLANLANKACALKQEDRHHNVFEFRTAIEDSIRYWDAINICDKAENKLQQMRELFQQKIISIESTQEIHRMFIQILASFESARDIWPECIEAREGIDSALYLMIDLALQQHRPKQAMSLYEELSEPDPTLLKIIQNAISYTLDVEHAQKIAAEHNPAKSKKGRKILVFALTSGALVLVIFALVYAHFYGTTITTTRLIYTHSFLLFAALTGVFLGRRTLLTTTLGKNQARAMILGALGAVSNALSGHILLGEDAAHLIMTVDTYILGMTFGNSTDAIKSGFKIMIVCFSCGFISLKFPEWTHQLLMASVIISMFWSMLDWYGEE